MTGRRLACGKCGGEMQPGFLMDLFHKSLMDEGAEQLRWVEGDADERTFWSRGVKLSGKERRKVLTYCCRQCGFLESFAPPEAREAE
jgi:Domain of unknown function (DUF6487)